MHKLLRNKTIIQVVQHDSCCTYRIANKVGTLGINTISSLGLSCMRIITLSASVQIKILCWKRMDWGDIQYYLHRHHVCNEFASRYIQSHCNTLHLRHIRSRLGNSNDVRETILYAPTTVYISSCSMGVFAAKLDPIVIAHRILYKLRVC